MGFLFIVFVPTILFMFKEGSYSEGWIFSGITLVVFLLLIGTRYIISENYLIVKIWFITTGILNIADIRSINRSYNPLSSPAASLKRLRINFFRGRPWLISPVNEIVFIEELKRINPYIDINIPDQKDMWRIEDWDI